jgi:hypothetical protein
MQAVCELPTELRVSQKNKVVKDSPVFAQVDCQARYFKPASKE